MRSAWEKFFTKGLLAVLLFCPTGAMAQTVGDAASFAVLGGQSVSAGGTGSVITGDVGVSPGTSITGFPAAATVVPPFTTHAEDGPAIAAQTSTTALYTSLLPGSCGAPTLMQLNGAVFTPGTYCFSSSADLAATGNMTLNGAGLYIFQVGSSLTANVDSTVTLQNGADPCNVFWQVTSAATLNGVNFVGNVVAAAGVTLGVDATLTGRALTTSLGAVSMSGNNTVSGCSSPGPSFLVISKTSAASVQSGATLVYTLSYSNIGGTAATGVLITETVPDHTTFEAAPGTPGWSCADGSPAASVCTLARPDLPPGGQGVALFAVTVDDPAGTTVIANSVNISSVDGPGGGGGNMTTVEFPAPAPLLDFWGWWALMVVFAGVAWVGLRRARRA